MEHATINDWLKSQLSTTDGELPMRSLVNLILKRYDKQRICVFHRMLKPKPAIIILDEAEILMRSFRDEFFAKLCRLARKGRDEDTFRLVLLIKFG